jgi:hypothetical protein
MIIPHLKTPRLMIAVLAASLVIGTSIVVNYIRQRAVDPRVTTEFNNRATANRIPPRQTNIPTMISGEVAHTADRIGEATALALAASLYAASEQIGGRTPRGVRDLLAGLAARNFLPPRLAFTQAEGTLVSPYGHLSVRYRPVPLAIEVVSIGCKPDNGPALIVRVPDENIKPGEAKLFVANSLSSVRVPSPFAPAPEVIALGWSPERLRALK